MEDELEKERRKTNADQDKIKKLEDMLDNRERELEDKKKDLFDRDGMIDEI